MPYLKKKYRNGQPRGPVKGNVANARRSATVKKYEEFSANYEYPVTPPRTAATRSALNLVPEHVILERLLHARPVRHSKTAA
jgi:hypothetical protein